MKISIIVRFTFPGIHSWPTAPQDRRERYLREPHRHLFYVEATKTVTHSNRDIEFIELCTMMEGYCRREFTGPHTLSCEAIALVLLDQYGLSRCRVFEDNENGAEVSVD